MVRWLQSARRIVHVLGFCFLSMATAKKKLTRTQLGAAQPSSTTGRGTPSADSREDQQLPVDDSLKAAAQAIENAWSKVDEDVIENALLNQMRLEYVSEQMAHQQHEKIT